MHCVICQYISLTFFLHCVIINSSYGKGDVNILYFYETLQSIMKQKGLSIPEVARLSGLPDSTVRSIISRKNKTVALEVAFKLSKGLKISLEELNGEISSTSIIVSPAKKKVLESIDALNDEQIRAVLAFIDSLQKIESTFKEKSE